MANHGHTKIEIGVRHFELQLPAYCKVNFMKVPVTIQYHGQPLGIGYAHNPDTNALKIKIVNTRVVQHLKKKLHFGIAGLIEEEHTEEIDGKEVRVIDRMQLTEVAIVPYEIDGIKHIEI